MKPSREGEGLSLGLEGMPTCLAHLAVAPVRCAAHTAAQPPARCWCGGACARQLRHTAGLCRKLDLFSPCRSTSELHCESFTANFSPCENV